MPMVILLAIIIACCRVHVALYNPNREMLLHNLADMRQSSVRRPAPGVSRCLPRSTDAKIHGLQVNESYFNLGALAAVAR